MMGSMLDGANVSYTHTCQQPRGHPRMSPCWCRLPRTTMIGTAQGAIGSNSRYLETPRVPAQMPHGRHLGTTNMVAVAATNP